jgi:hypothetical protein
MNTWYEINIQYKIDKKYILTTQSLEYAEQVKKSLDRCNFIDIGRKIIIEEWRMINDIPVLKGEI